MASPLNNAAWIEWVAGLMGGVSRQTIAATFPANRFYCLLDEVPIHLIPPRLRSLLQASDHPSEPLYLNPECMVCAGEQLPPDLGLDEQLLSGFARQGTIAWVRDRTNNLPLPFWLGPKLGILVGGLKQSEEIPQSVPTQVRQLLAAADIFVSEHQRELNAINRPAAVRTAATLFRATGYAPLGNLIHPFHIAALRRYYRQQIRSGAVKLGDRQSSRRYVAYNEPVARFFHQQIASTLSAVIGDPVKPSYAYLSSYLSGAELEKHIDRDQCEFSVTFCLDFSPEPTLASPWPIKLETPKGIVTVYQAIGDGLLYRGTRLPHFRDRLGEGQTSTSFFFHYVASDFNGSLG